MSGSIALLTGLLAASDKVNSARSAHVDRQLSKRRGQPSS